MINKKISEDKKMVKIWERAGCQGLVVHTWLIAHLDRDGRHNGEPALLKAKIAPRIPDVTEEIIIKTLCAACRLRIVRWYVADDDMWLEFINFKENQKGLRYSTEAASDCPPFELNVTQQVRTYCDSYCDSKCDSDCHTRCGASLQHAPRKRREENEREENEREDEEPKPTEPAAVDPPKPKAPISSVSSFSSLSDIASQLVPLEHEPETDEAEEGGEIETVGEFLDACAKLDIKISLTEDGQGRLREVLRQAPISADDFRFATNKAIRNNKRTAGYVAGIIRGRRIDARDQKATPPQKTPPESPGNGASRGVRLPLYEAEPPPSPEQQEANARAAKAYGEKLREQWNGN